MFLPALALILVIANVGRHPLYAGLNQHVSCLSSACFGVIPNLLQKGHWLGGDGADEKWRENAEGAQTVHHPSGWSDIVDPPTCHSSERPRHDRGGNGSA